jgi:hypothetical protein
MITLKDIFADTAVPVSLQRAIATQAEETHDSAHAHGTLLGFVANFAQKVMTGQLPLSVRRLGSERIELFGRSEALFPSLNHHLFFPDHVHEFDPN